MYIALCEFNVCVRGIFQIKKKKIEKSLKKGNEYEKLVFSEFEAQTIQKHVMLVSIRSGYRCF